MILGIVPSFLLSQEIGPRFDRISINEGLSQSTVNAILQDREGFLWFGTQDGLNKYDGYNFKIFRNNPSDSNSISDNWISCLYLDQKGDIWIGTYHGGLNRYDANNDKFIRYYHHIDDSNTISGNNVTSIIADQRGIYWIGIWGGGVSRYDPKTNSFTHLRYNSNSLNTLSNNNVRCIVEDKTGLIWIGTWSGLNSYDPVSQKFTRYLSDSSNPKSISANQIISIFEDHDGHLWISTFMNGIDRYDREKNEFVHHQHTNNPYSLNNNKVGQIIQDFQGDLWISTRSGGLNRLEMKSGRFFSYQHNRSDVYSLSNDLVFSLYRDNTGSIWIGTDGGGLSYYNPKKYKFSHYRFDNTPQGLSHPTIRSILEDSHGNIWIGTHGGGLNLFDKKNHKYIHFLHDPKIPQSLGQNSVLALLEDSNGNIWIGTDGGGLDLYNKKINGFEHHINYSSDTNSISNNYVLSLFEDKNGILWIGTSGGGLNSYNPKNKMFTRFIRRGNSVNELSGNYIWSIYEDHQNQLWVGTWGAGLNCFDQKSNKNKIYQFDPTDPSSLSNNTVLCMNEDPHGNLWTGTQGGGLNRFDKNTANFERFTENEGLPNNVVYGILPDDQGYLWLSTNKGLSRFDPQRRVFKNYDEQDGLQSNEFNQGAYHKNRKGDLYFGGVNGFNVFNPAHIQDNTNVPPVVITQFKIFDQPIHFAKLTTEKGIIELPYSNNFFSFEFAALDYTAPQKNRYMYMLEGFDQTWIQTGSRRYAAYTNLDPGRYIFKIKGSNNDGLWNEEGISLPLLIAPPYWKTIWFRGAFIASLLAIGLIIYRYRINQLKKEKNTQQQFSKMLIEFQENERKRIASELHDSLGQDLLIIKNSLQQCATMVPPKSDLDEDLRQISDIAQQTINEVREISYDLYPHILDRLGLSKAITSVINKFAQTSSIKFSSNINNIDGIFTKGNELNIFRILQEAINNVVQHSDAKMCDITMRRKENKFFMTIKDDGKGFHPTKYLGSSSDHKGIGLLGMQERIKLLNGKMYTTSSHAQGTEITFSIPVVGGL